MGSGIPLDDAAIISTVLEGILYGFSVLMFIGTVWVLSRAGGRQTTNWMIISVATVFLVLSTAHMIVDIVRIYEGLVKYRDTFPGGPLAFFADVAQDTFVAKNAIYTLQTLVGDAVVIYRCYVVWQSVWIIVLPSMLWCSVAVTAVSSVYSVSQATANASNIFAERTARWITAFFASTLATNLLSTGLLAYRIWTVERRARSLRSSKSLLMPFLRVFIDAAALYSATLLATLLCFLNSNNGQYVVLDLIMPIISIAFYVVLIRVSMNRKTVVTSDLNVSHHSSYQMRPIEVHISQSSRSDAILQPLSSSQNIRGDFRVKEEPDDAPYVV